MLKARNIKVSDEIGSLYSETSLFNACNLIIPALVSCGSSLCWVK